MIHFEAKKPENHPEMEGFCSTTVGGAPGYLDCGIKKLLERLRAGPAGSLRNDDFAASEQVGVQRKCARSQEYDGHGHDARKNRGQPGIKEVWRRRGQDREPDAQGAQAYHHTGQGCENPYEKRSAGDQAQHTGAPQDRRHRTSPSNIERALNQSYQADGSPQ